ncbi:MAG: hypothetical protein KC464_27520, partial [Myxococcales bacterium]|nr:hypothetical protein [Myxococcales bacterium]
PLAADPGGATGTPQWGVGFGGAASDIARGVAFGPDGTIYVAGDFEDAATFGSLGERTSAGKSDAFVAAIGADGKPAWVKTLGGPNEESGDAIAVGADGTIAVGGLFSDTMKVDAIEARSNGSDDLYVAAYAPDGAAKWLWTTGGKASDTTLALAATADGGFVAGGAFFGTVPFGTGELTAIAREEAFLVKLDSGGNVAWARSFGGDLDDRIVKVAVDPQGSIVALALFQGKASFGGEQLESAGGFDLAVVKFDAEGHHLWSHRLGGAFDEVAGGIAVDVAGNVAISGAFDDKLVDGDQTFTSNGESDILVARFTPDGARSWIRTWGGRREDVGQGAAADAAGNIIATGWFQQKVDFGGPYKLESNDLNKDVVVVKLDAAGQVVWVQTLGDHDHDQGRAVAVDAAGDVAVAGIFRFHMKLPTPIESVHAPAERAPKADAFVVRLAR